MTRDAAEVLAEVAERIAIEDRDRTIAGDYRSDTYAEHSDRYIRGLDAAGYVITPKAARPEPVDEEGTQDEEYWNIWREGWNAARKAARPVSGLEAAQGELDLTDAEVEVVYAAYDLTGGGEATTIEGKRRIVIPIVQAVIDFDRWRDACPTPEAEK